MAKKTKEEIRNERIAERMTSCKHFNGTGVNDDKTCRAGVNYRQLVGGENLGWACRIPCIKTSLTKNVVACDKRELFTFDESAKVEADIEARTEKFTAAFNVVHEDAKKNGLGRGKGGHGAVKCPNCEGTIHYSVAGVNGHIHARCSTQGCVAWME